MWQKCPICNGTGKQENFDTPNKYSTCKTCLGTGIINTLTGKPPIKDNKDFRDLQQGESQQIYFGNK